MTIDDRALHELIVESEDLQADALRDQRRVNADLAEIHAQDVHDGIDRDEVRHHAQLYNDNRERVLRDGPGAGVLAAGGAMAALFGAALTSLMAGPAAADDSDVDVMVLQTAASLENLAVATYGAALTLPFIKDGNATVVAFAKKTMGQHKDHGSAFNDNAKGLGASNWGRYSNPKLDEALAKAGAEFDDPKREAIIKDAVKVVMDDVGIIPLYHYKNIWASRPDLKVVPWNSDRTVAMQVSKAK